MTGPRDAAVSYLLLLWFVQDVFPRRPVAAGPSVTYAFCLQQEAEREETMYVFFYSTRYDPHEPNLKSEGNTDLLSAAAFVVTRRCRASWLRSLLCENVSQISATNFPAWQLSMYNEIIWYSVATNYVQFGDVSGDMRETQITFHL